MLPDTCTIVLIKPFVIAGLRECILRNIPLDEGYRLRADILKSTIEEDKQKGLTPFLVIGSAGTTDVGAVDPLDDIANISEEHNLWFHVDGAYGAFFMLSEMLRPKLKGIERADSVVMDPHKGLFLPYGSGLVLVKDREKMYEAHYYQANYMQDTLAEQDELSPADLSPELTKHFRGLRMWLPLKMHGLAPFRACLEEKVWLTRYFYEEIQKTDGFEVGPYPELSVATFWYIPKEGNPNAFNEKLVNLVKKDGRVFLSSTQLEGKFIIRLAVLSFRAHQQIIDLTLQVLKEKVQELLLAEKV